MRDGKTQYGVQKLIAINSGKYLFAELDLSKPLHLAAPNNRGKSTLVNALQFLYIDDFGKMKFGTRSPEDTRRHYFGDEGSYLIFECRTPSGLQCMLVRGLGNLRAAYFKRYVYSGIFKEDDYVSEDRDIRTFQDVRTKLADRQFTEVKRTHLWHVLGSGAESEDGKAQPRLNILPIRKREEYETFRDVFARLLSLSAADAKTLKQLIIDSHARDVGERKIDIAAEYRDEFQRIERSDKELQFLRAVSALIEKGRELRLEAEVLRTDIDQTATPAQEQAWQCHRLIEVEQERLNQASVDLQSKQRELQKTRDDSMTALGAERNVAERITQERDALSASHQKWQAYTPQLIKEMRRNLKSKNSAVVSLEQSLEQAATLDASAMGRRIEQLRQKLAANSKAYQQWQSTIAAELRRAGVSDSELEASFRLLNDQLLTLVVGDAVTIRNADEIRTRIRALAKRIKNNTYTDDAVVANLSSVPVPDASYWRNRDELKNRNALDQEELNRQESRLQVAKNQEEAQEKLTELSQERDELQNELADYDAYVAAWGNRRSLDKRKKEAEKAVAKTEEAIQELDNKLRSNTDSIAGNTNDLHSAKDLKRQLSAAAEKFHEALRRLHMEVLLPGTDEQAQPSPAPFDAKKVQAATGRLQQLTQSIQRIEQLQEDRRRLQNEITEKSRQFEAQLCYFGDEEEEWTRLIEGLESLPEREEANERSWDALIRPLGARLNGIIVAMQNIKLAVERLNTGLRAYQVSNLRAVELQAEEVHAIYSPLEALAGADSLFHDPEAVDLAKLRLRRMIEANQVIELPSLFEIRIRCQLANGTWQQAASLDEIGSTGTGMTTKAMIFIQLVRAVARDKKFMLHFYLDGLGELDDRNLSATAEMAVSQGITPITADPRLHLEPLAHPEVTVYSLGQTEEGRFYIDKYRTYRARRAKSLSVAPNKGND